MSFWDLSDGGNATDTGTEFEIPSGNLEPIPDGSSVLAMIDEAKWDSKDEADFISLRWSVLSPDEYKNRKVFQKLWVTDDDPSAKDADKAAKKRDKARRMLAAIDSNAGGKLAKGGQPSDNDLTACLCNKPMIIKCMIWSIPDRESPGSVIEGNWIAAVAPKAKGIDVKPAKPRPAATATPAATGVSASFDDDEIPF
jgi:hypothetical protein